MSVTSTEANIKSTKDGIEYLIKDHQMFKDLFDQFRSASSQEDKLHIVNKIVKEVSMHASAEERYFYPLILTKFGRNEGKILYERNVVDDQINKEILHFLEMHRPASADDCEVYNRTVDKFIAIELDHMKQEEEIVMNKLRPMMSSEELAKLEDDLIWAKKYGPTHPHPSAPAKPIQGANILHPIAGLVDKMLDSAAGRSV